MRNIVAIVVLLAGIAGACGSLFGGLDPHIFRRGDANVDGTVDGSDPIVLAAYIYQGGSLGCLNQADVNDDGAIDASDIVYLNAWLYLGGGPPPAPGPFATECSEDSSPLGCETLPAGCY